MGRIWMTPAEAAEDVRRRTLDAQFDGWYWRERSVAEREAGDANAATTYARYSADRYGEARRLMGIEWVDVYGERRSA